MIRPRFVCLAFVMAVFSASPALADEPAADAVVLDTGERIACEILAASEETVRVRIGAQTYDFERSTLTSIERAGKPELDPAHLRFVRDLAPRLVHADARLAKAAQAGLAALGEEGRPYLEAVANTSKDANVSAALRAVLRPDRAERQPAPSPTAMIDAWIERSKTTLALEAAQEPGFRKALESFFQEGRSSGDWQAAWKSLREALAKFLTDAQMKKFDAMRTQRGGG